MDRWISGPACDDFPSFPFQAASGTRIVVGGEGASAFGGAWLSPIALPDPSVPLEASFTRPPPVLHLAGDIDEWTYPYLRQVLARAAAAGERRIRVDLADVRYCDVAGLRAIMSLASRQRCGSGTIDQIILEHLPAPLQQLARILGWDATPGVILDGCSC